MVSGATANTHDGEENRRLSSTSPAEAEEGEEGGMKGKHDLAPVISPGDSRKGNPPL